MNKLVIDMCYIITEVFEPEITAMSVSDVFTNIDTFLNIVVNCFVIIGGVLGFNYIRKLRERQKDSTFSYLIRLSIRLKYFRELMVNYKDEIMDRFAPENYRREISADRVILVEEVIEQLAKNASETLEFLQSEDNQMPAQLGWVDCFYTFIEFLIDCEHLKKTTYFKWLDDSNLEGKKNYYYEKHLDNIDKLLKMAYDCQCGTENDMFKSS